MKIKDLWTDEFSQKYQEAYEILRRLPNVENAGVILKYKDVEDKNKFSTDYWGFDTVWFLFKTTIKRIYGL